MRKRERELIRIAKDGSSKLLIECDNSMTKVLGESDYVFGRVYFVGPDTQIAEARTRIAQLAREWNLSDYLV